MDKEWQQIEGFKRFARVHDSTQASSRLLIEFTRVIRQSFKAFEGPRPFLVAHGEAQTAAPQSNHRLGNERRGAALRKTRTLRLAVVAFAPHRRAARRLTPFQAARSVPETVCPTAPLVRATRATARI